MPVILMPASWIWMIACLAASLACALCAGPLPARGEEKAEPKALRSFELLDNDRVAFVGNAFFEREQRNSYLETLIAAYDAGKHAVPVGYRRRHAEIQFAESQQPIRGT